MRILWENEIDKYTIVASTENGNYLAANLQDTRLSRYTRTTSPSSQTWDLDLAAAKPISYAAIAGHNITSGATVKVIASLNADYSTTDFQKEFAHSSEIMLEALDTGVTDYRYWRFSVNDAANPAGYIQIARLYLDTYLQMPPIRPALDLPLLSTTIKEKSISGQSYADRGYIYRAPAFFFPLIEQSERLAIEEMFEEVENVKPVFLLVWESSLDKVGPLYCSLIEAGLKWGKLREGLLWELSLDFEEEF